MSQLARVRRQAVGVNRTGRRCTWRVGEKGSALLTTPDLFAGFSVWGNQWNKLMYFYHDWYRNLNLLVSIYDIYRAAASIRTPILQDGLRQYIPAYVRHVRHYVRDQSNVVNSPYKDYSTFPPGRIPSFPGSIMVDSGGYSFGDRSKLVRLEQMYGHLANRNPGDWFSRSVKEFADTMLKVSDYESAEEKAWDKDAIARLAAVAQQINLSHQLAIRGDIVVTLDRVISDYDLSLGQKKRRAFFNLQCAKAALREKAEAGNGFQAALLAVIHPVGPGPTELKVMSAARAYRQYRHELDCYVGELADVEKSLRISFDGLGIGSLVPLQNYELIRIVATAVKHTLREYNMEDRLLHAFGATNNKARFLFDYGFDTFDTTYHMVRAKNRYLYDPTSERYVASGELDFWNCSCPICVKHPLVQLRENRSGVKEVATVLHGLHNLYTNHLEEIRSLGT